MTSLQTRHKGLRAMFAGRHEEGGLVRLAVGIENISDILADLDAGFRAAKQA